MTRDELAAAIEKLDDQLVFDADVGPVPLGGLLGEESGAAVAGAIRFLLPPDIEIKSALCPRRAVARPPLRPNGSGEDQRSRGRSRASPA
jgi:hypothetical protein